MVFVDVRENQSFFSVDFCCKLQEFGPGKKEKEHG